MTSEKRQPPVWLDMDFGEALARFAQTDLKEVEESVDRAKAEKPPVTLSHRRKLGKRVGKPPARER